MAFENQLLFSGILILIAAVLDFLDGFMAKMLDAISEVGKQLDSLADIISFGMAPASLVYKLLEFVLRQSEGISGITGTSIGFRIILLSPVLLVLCTAIRLANFNVQKGINGFMGLATPASAIFFAGITLTVLMHPESSLTSFLLQVIPLTVCILIVSLLMIVPLPMFSLKFTGFRWNGNGIRYIFLSVSGILLIILQEIALPLIIVIYMFMSILQNLLSPFSK
jgi:CDP-diacylglycerol--serine O-phosphatidyltransferase